MSATRACACLSLVPMNQEDSDASDNELDQPVDDAFEPLVCAVDESAWTKTVPRTRTRRRDIVNATSGLTDSSRHVSSFAEAFSLFMTVDTKQSIVRYTNQKGLKTHGSDWNAVSMMEMDAYLGLLIAMGANHDQKTSIPDLWSARSDFHFPLYSHVMARDRFKQINTCIRFDDGDTRAERQQSNRLAAIADVTERVRANCVMHLNPGPYLTVDEKIVPFNGNCRFRVYMQNKPDKYGLKMWMLSDCTTWYVKNFDVYLGKTSNKSETNQGQRVVLQLSSCLPSGHNITTDNFFTSCPLALELLRRDITLLGTLRQNKRGIPKELLDKNRDEYTSEFRFTKDLTIVSYVPKKKKTVLVLSSGQPEKRFDSGPKRKPLMIMAYNETKAGVDTSDKMTKEYTTKRASRRWTLALFTNLIDICLLNAYVLYSYARGEKTDRRRLHLDLASFLCKPLVDSRSPAAIGRQESGKAFKPRGKRCSLCHGTRHLKKTATEFCCKCHAAVCPVHFSVSCADCMRE